MQTKKLIFNKFWVILGLKEIKKNIFKNKIKSKSKMIRRR